MKQGESRAYLVHHIIYQSKMNRITALSDLELVAQIKAGNSRAFDQLYRKYFDQVFLRCLSFTACTSEAQDLAQEVFIKLLDRVHRFEERSKFSTWMYSLVTNYCIDHTRKLKRNKIVSSEHEIPDVAEEFDFDITSLNILDNVDLIFESISDFEKELLMMKYKDGKSINELCAFYEMKSSAVKMRLNRAKAKINKNRSALLAA